MHLCCPCPSSRTELTVATIDITGILHLEVRPCALDRKPDDVTKFRGDKWKMPWLHTFVTYDKPLITALEVIAFPRLLLVDGNGTIVAMETDLRGEQLEKTLAKFLREAK